MCLTVIRLDCDRTKKNNCHGMKLNISLCNTLNYLVTEGGNYLIIVARFDKNVMNKRKLSHKISICGLVIRENYSTIVMCFGVNLLTLVHFFMNDTVDNLNYAKEKLLP